MELSKLIKECQETLKRNMTLEDLNNAINEVERDPALCCYFKFYNDIENKDYCIAIGADEQNFIYYKFGIIGNHTMVLDYSDIEIAYNIEDGSLFDSEVQVNGSIDNSQYEYIVTKELEDFISYCYEQNPALFEELFLY